MEQDGDGYPRLDQLIQAYLHQDMDLVHGSEADAVDAFVADETPASISGLLEELDRFESLHHNDLHGAFLDRYRYDFHPGSDSDAVTAFFALVRSRAAAEGSP